MRLGWIRLHRKLLTSDVWRALNSDQRVLLIVCLLKASHQAHEIDWGGCLRVLEPGQFAASQDSLTELCGISRQKLRTALTKLVKWHFLTIESTKHGSIISVMNWGIYQGEGEEANQAFNHPSTNEQPTSNHKQECNKNGKNGKEVHIANFSQSKDAEEPFLPGPEAPAPSAEKKRSSRKSACSAESEAVVARWLLLGKNPKDYSAREERTHRSIQRHIEKHGLEAVLEAVERIHRDHTELVYLCHVANAFGEKNAIAPYYAADWKPCPEVIKGGGAAGVEAMDDEEAICAQALWN